MGGKREERQKENEGEEKCEKKAEKSGKEEEKKENKVCERTQKAKSMGLMAVTRTLLTGPYVIDFDVHLNMFFDISYFGYLLDIPIDEESHDSRKMVDLKTFVFGFTVLAFFFAVSEYRNISAVKSMIETQKAHHQEVSNGIVFLPLLTIDIL